MGSSKQELVAEACLIYMKQLENQHKERMRKIHRNHRLLVGLALFLGVGIPIIQAMWAIYGVGK